MSPQWYEGRKPREHELFSSIRNDPSKNFHGYKVGIGYMSGQGAYGWSKSLSAIDIISYANPWQVTFKLAEPIVERYNLTVVDHVGEVYPICTAVGIIFGILPSEGMHTVPFFELVFMDLEFTGVLYLDRTAIESRGLFYDLSAPFNLSAWLISFIAAVLIATFLKATSELRPEVALFATLAPFVNVVLSLRVNRAQVVYSIWVGGCLFLVNAYLSTLTSNTVLTVDYVTVKNLAELQTERYNIICTTQFNNKIKYLEKYNYMKEVLYSNVTAKLVENYGRLLDMYVDEVYSYNQQYKLLSNTKTALFGELHHLNVFRGIIPLNEVRNYVFTDSALFPKMKTALFQVHHADVIARALKYLISNGIFQYWENIRFLADRLAWQRALKELFKAKIRQEAEASTAGVGLRDTLIVAILYCYFMGIFLSCCAGTAEMLTDVCKRNEKKHVSKWIP